MGLIPVVVYLIVGMATAVVAHLFLSVPVFEKLAEDGHPALDTKWLSYLSLFTIYFLIAPFMLYATMNFEASENFKLGLYNSYKNA